MEIGQQIIRYRKQQALSQEELAEKVYVSRQSISNWENDKTSLSETPYCHCIFPHYYCHLFCKSFYFYMVVPFKLVDNKIKLSVTLGFILFNSIQQ